MMRAAAVALSLLVALSISAAKPEKWYDAYSRGVNAVSGGNHSAAAQALQQAIAEMPNENAQARGRNETFVYVPHFWLGIAKFNLGDIDGALREFRISEEQGVVQNTRYYSDLREWMSRVQAQKQKSADSIASEGKREAGAAAKAAVSAQMDAVAAGGDRTEPYRAALRKLQEAREVAAKAGTDLKEYRRSAELAGQAKGLFAAALEEAKKLKASRPAPVVAAAKPAPAPHQPPVAVQPSVEKPKEVVATATAAPAPVAAPVPQPPALSAAVADARVSVQQYRRRLSETANEHRRDVRMRDWVRDASREADGWQKALAGTPADDAAREIETKVAARSRELGLRITEIERASTIAREEVQPALERAWRAYASGDLARAEELLTRVLASRASAEAYLLRGCGRYTQAMLSKKPDAVLATAEADFRAALKMNRALRLDPKTFSPKLVSYFDGLKRRG
jgi:tetratricopeptide (TPR) repeat protein